MMEAKPQSGFWHLKNYEQHSKWAKTIALKALHVSFSLLSISLLLSAKQKREIAKFQVL